MKLILSLILALICLPASAQNKISPTGHFQLERFRKEHVAVSRSGIPDSIPTITAIVRLNSGHTPAVLTDNGYNVTADLGDIALVRAAITEFEKIAAMPQVKSISFGKKQRMLMKSARTASQVTEAHAGINISGTATSYTGKGVVLGLMDGGLDPNHINFSGRVDRLWHLTYNTYTNNVGSTEYNASTVGGFTTDDEEETHATHVAGIMAGGYKGSGTYMNGSTKTTGAIPHYGVAPDATLALSCGELYDPAILQGVSNIIDYAEAIGQPAAINLSLGSNSGPHDGTDDFSTALDRLGERALICVAAGNEGENNMSIEKTFTSSATSVKTLLYYNNAYFEGNYGYLDIWASDSQPLTVSISNCSSSGALTYTTTISSATNMVARCMYMPEWTLTTDATMCCSTSTWHVRRRDVSPSQ